MSYDLSVQPRGKSQGATRSSVELIVANIPGVRHYRSTGIFEYGHPPGCVLQIFVEGEPQADSVSLSLPAAYNRKDTVALALLLAFRIADHVGWEVVGPHHEFDREWVMYAITREQWATRHEV